MGLGLLCWAEADVQNYRAFFDGESEGVEGQGSASGSGSQNVGDDAGAMNKSGNGSANGTIEWKCN